MDHHAGGQGRPKPRPQLYVQLQFGLSWSDQQPPSPHTVTYKSRNLKNARECGNYPRQLPPPNTNFLAVQDVWNPQAQPVERPHRSKQPRAAPAQQAFHSYYGHPAYNWAPQAPRDQHRQRDQPADHPLHPTARPRRESRASHRSGSLERGRSAPPLFLDSPWDADMAPSATLLPPPQPKTAKKARPAPPSQFRLGSDGMPWQAFSWPDGVMPADEEEAPRRSHHQDRVPFINQPTTVPLEGPQRCRTEDPSRVQDLETLSTAMMTVDNGFENQWWNQGGRTPTDMLSAYPPSREGSPDYALEYSASSSALPTRTTSMPDAIVSAIEPTYSSRPDWLNSPVDDEPESLPDSLRRGGIVSPMSESHFSPAASFRSPYRRQSTRSDEGTMARYA